MLLVNCEVRAGCSSNGVPFRVLVTGMVVYATLAVLKFCFKKLSQTIPSSLFTVLPKIKFLGFVEDTGR